MVEFLAKIDWQVVLGVFAVLLVMFRGVAEGLIKISKLLNNSSLGDVGNKAASIINSIASFLGKFGFGAPKLK